ncbi:MAG: hypothetical protein AABW80_03720 [Nanoarchaeota archaeon]
MGFYDGFQFLRRKKTGLQIVPLSIRGEVLDEGDHYLVRINDALSTDEKIKAVIHECLHFGENYRKYAGRMRRLPEGEYTRIEGEIDSITDQVYESQPLLVEWLREKFNVS